MNGQTYIRWAGRSAILSAAAMIVSVAFTIFGYAVRSLTFGTHTHSVIVESFDVLTTAFLLPLPFAFGRIYANVDLRLSRLATIIGAVTFTVVTILHVLFVFEVMWFSDPISLYLYGLIGAGFIAWLIMLANLARRSAQPPHGVLRNLIGATIVGFPVWALWTGYLLASGSFMEQPSSEVAGTRPADPVLTSGRTIASR